MPRWENKGEITARALLYNRLAHPEHSISEIYKIVHKTTGLPISSIRRVKSVMLSTYKAHVAILEDESK